MVVVGLVLGISSVWNDSAIVDEIPHIGAGYSYITKGDNRLNPEHPPLAKDLAGIGLQFVHVNGDAFNSRFWNDDLNGQWEFGKKLIYGSGNDAVKLIRAAKLPLFLFFIFCAFLIWKFTRKIYGENAAMLATFLFAFSPTVIAHSRFVTTDMAALFGVMIGSYFFFKYLQSPTRKNFILAGIFFGVAQLCKFSVFLLAPYFVVLALLYAFLFGKKHPFREAGTKLLFTILIMMIGYIFVVWPVYYVQNRNYPVERQKAETKILLSTHGNKPLVAFVNYFSDKPVVRAMANYGLGFLMVTQRATGGNTTYFMGDVRNWAWPQYFPIVYFLKEPLPFWIMLAGVALFFSVRLKKPSFNYKRITEHFRNHFIEYAMLLWLAIYWATSIKSNLNIGVRHLMPVYGFTFILLSGQIGKIYTLLKNKAKAVNAFVLILAALMCWYVYENISVYPYYLTYFNQVAGGPAGGSRYVVDSNLDWGQDLKRLSDWANASGADNIYFDYFGWADPKYYLGDKIHSLSSGNYMSKSEFLKVNPNGGYMAISASFYRGSIQDPATSYAWLENYKPETIIGNSIYVWKFMP